MLISTVKKIRSYFDDPKIFILILWILLNIFLLLKNGVVTVGEAEKYIGEAHRFADSGTLSSSNYWLYFTQIFLLTVSFKLNLGFVFVLIIQMLFNFIACFCFYRLLENIFGRKDIALVGTGILISNFFYQEFNTFLQTESLFYSFSLIFTCYLLRIDKLSVNNVVRILAWLILLSFTRPTGLLFLPPAVIYLFFRFLKNISIVKKTILFSGSVILFLFVLDKALGSGGEFDFMLPFRSETIICGVPTLQGPIQIDAIENGNSVYGLFYYIMHNFGQFLRLSGERTLAFFGLYRNYYSRSHNIYLVAYFYPLYLLAFLGIRYWFQNHLYIVLYFFSVILLTWITVFMSCDDWHNRFFLSISPYLIIMSMGAVVGFLKKLR
ncbi:MAG: glycosyltransferase family 39 protein [Bacteroidetes bacterium]|nr:glycosyltransferase family 39 protein [Bacteroidota bacterium]